MIGSFKSKALREFWEAGRSTKIDNRMATRIRFRLDVLHAANSIDQLKVPGFDFHALKGFSPTRSTIHINGPWCLTFEFAHGEALRIDPEQYH